jgi:hypothetical protein
MPAIQALRTLEFPCRKLLRNLREYSNAGGLVKSKLPGKLGVRAALHLRRIHTLKLVIEFRVVVPQQILAH